MTYTLVLTDEAQEDFEDILASTQLKWGDEQRQRYAVLLNTALEKIANDPRLGRKRQGTPPGYQLYHAGCHYIVYRVMAQTIFVARILHDRMDIARHLR